jgi:hypothetical protein
MADQPKDESFFRKVVRFVANPATDWADLNSRQDELKETELEKSELKAMIERKRRNDFVRKREFDMLRKVRREGLSSEQLAALEGISRLDDSESKPESGAKPDQTVKAKIDEIEQQMVGEGGFATTSRRATGFGSTAPGGLNAAPVSARAEPPPPAAPRPATAKVADVVAARAPASSPAPAKAPLNLNAAVPEFSGFDVEVSEVVHDPDLDEAVIAFANADFEGCEQSLVALTGVGGGRAQHAETWLVRFDLYRAIGQQHQFESLALDYAQQFGWSAPQWFSMPKLVAEAAAEERPARSRVSGEVGWVCPELLDADAVAKLRSQALQMPLPWVFDFSALRSIDAEASAKLSELFRHWASEPLEMRWLGGERLFEVLADAAPTGVRDADPAFWVLRLDALRLANRPDAFDEAAIDYCVTYEVSPPSWERARCNVHVSGNAVSTQSPPLSMVSDVSTTFVESSMSGDTGPFEVAGVELSGQLVGDIGATLAKLDTELGNASLVNVSCAKLIRVDFIAAGDLLNWVLARRAESRVVTFCDAQRLVALFFGAMGINEHAKVKVRNV